MENIDLEVIVKAFVNSVVIGNLFILWLWNGILSFQLKFVISHNAT